MPTRSELNDFVEELAERIDGLADRSTPAIRRVRRDASRTIRAWPAAAVLQAAYKILARKDVPRWVAYELINQHPNAPALIDGAKLKRLGRGLSSWGDVDAFSCYVAGPAWREGRVTDEVIHGWAASPSRWWRRAALVSTVALNAKARGGTGDTDRTLAMCDLLRSDRDELVVKALSWALRELIPRDAESVAAYVELHQDSLPARVVREVRNKLATGLKSGKAK